MEKTGKLLPIFGERALVVAAHPDDDVLGAGGTIRRLVDEGLEVEVLYLADGESSRESRGVTTFEREIQNRVNASRRAMEILGVLKLHFLNLSDNMLDTYSNLELTKSVEQQIIRFKPSAVLTHSNSDLNVDHRAALQAVLTACRPTPFSSVNLVVSFEVLSSSEWKFDKAYPFTPNLFVDVSKTIGQKLKAFEQFDNEIRKYPHPRSIEGVESLAKYRGTVTGMNYAEAFEILYIRR